MLYDEVIEKTERVMGKGKTLLGRVRDWLTLTAGKPARQMIQSLDTWVELASLFSGLACKWICWLCFSSKQVGFQKILTLTYVDKLIDDVHRLFRDKYRTEIQQQSALSLLNGTFDFQNDFLRLLR